MDCLIMAKPENENNDVLLNAKLDSLEKFVLNEDHKDKVLCNHCKRTKNNGIRCLGICVADSEY